MDDIVRGLMGLGELNCDLRAILRGSPCELLDCLERVVYPTLSGESPGYDRSAGARALRLLSEGPEPVAAAKAIFDHLVALYTRDRVPASVISWFFAVFHDGWSPVLANSCAPFEDPLLGG